jgi:hypothetical protein
LRRLEVSTMKSGPLKEYNGFICDLTDRRTDLKWLINAELFDPDLLDGPTTPVLPVNTGVPILPSIRPQHGHPQPWEP